MLGGTTGADTLSYAFAGLAPGFLFSVDNSGGAFTFKALTDGIATTTAPVPLPATLWLLGPALGGLGLLCRRSC